MSELCRAPPFRNYLTITISFLYDPTSPDYLYYHYAKKPVQTIKETPAPEPEPQPPAPPKPPADEEMRTFIDKLATIVATRGQETETQIKQKQFGEPGKFE